MEKNFYNDNFEQLLKDSTDDFRMYPSKRVWHSLYNDLHPGKRWPSLAVCLLLISSVLYIGISNNNSINSISRRIAAENLLASTRANAEKKNDLAILEKPSKNIIGILPVTARTTGKFSNSIVSSKSLPIIHADNIDNFGDINNNIEAASIKMFIPESPETDVSKINISLKEIAANPEPVEPFVELLIPFTKPQDITTIKQRTKILNAQNSGALLINREDLAWIENHAFHNKSFSSKWKTKRSFQYYITPSIGYRQLEKNTSYEPASALVVSNPNSNLNINDIVNQNAAINLEAGAAILFDLSKKFRLKSGLQFNYTNYITHAFELKHPAQTTLLLNDLSNNFLMLAPYSSTYANTSGVSPKKLNNKTIQISVPIGADFKITGKNKLKWYAGATVQPTLVTSGNAYLISSDTKNYINEESLLRNWNINGGIETFISYKTNSGISINAGPQLRYQFLSTYSKQYTFTEKLYNVGLKMGITRSF